MSPGFPVDLRAVASLCFLAFQLHPSLFMHGPWPHTPMRCKRWRIDYRFPKQPEATVSISSASEVKALEHTLPLVRVQEEHLAVMALEVTSGPGGVSKVEPQRLASWRHPGPVTALQVRAPAQPDRQQLARLPEQSGGLS